MFSVLMSLYHKESVSNLVECLESLKEQTLKASEVILVIDGPISNNLLNIVEDYKSVLNIKIIKLEKNVGLGKALNRGLSYCNHDIVARMDTDDICLPNRFEKQIYRFYEDDNLALLGSGIIEFDENNNQRYKILPCNLQKIKTFCLYKNPFNHMTVVFRKSKVESVGGYKHHLFMEDYNLWIRMINRDYKLENTDDVLVKARVGSEMLKKRRGIKYIISEWELFLLKNKLLNIKVLVNFYVFLIRVTARVVPLSLLKLVYNNDRKRT